MHCGQQFIRLNSLLKERLTQGIYSVHLMTMQFLNTRTYWVYKRPRREMNEQITNLAIGHPQCSGEWELLTWGTALWLGHLWRMMFVWWLQLVWPAAFHRQRVGNCCKTCSEEILTPPRSQCSLKAFKKKIKYPLINLICVKVFFSNKRKTPAVVFPDMSTHKGDDVHS